MGEKAGDDAPFPLTDVDKWVLSQTDEEFKYHDWDELREIISESRYWIILRGLHDADNFPEIPTISRS